MKYQILHSSHYQDATETEIENEMVAFVGDCKDIVYIDTLNLGINLKTLRDLFYQVHCLADREENINLTIDKCEGDFPTFITVHLGRPIDKHEELQKLNAIKSSIKDMREGFDKGNSNAVRKSMEEIEQSLAT